MDRFSRRRPRRDKGSNVGVFQGNLAMNMKPETRMSLTAAFVAVGIFAPIFWMLLSREPPYVRTSGEIMPANPAPGSFVNVRWHIKVDRVCTPNVPRNVTRTVIDAKGVLHDYEPVNGVYGTADENPQEDLVRAFQLPVSIAVGPARYHSTACFSCNPIQYIWPVCVTTPDIAFEISKGLPPDDSR